MTERKKEKPIRENRSGDPARDCLKLKTISFWIDHIKECFMDYNETLEYIARTNWRGSKPGLERITKLCSLLGNPHKDLKFIHIAGTNGKGSAAAFLSSVLKSAGYKTGLFTSPYIEVFNERMQINGKNIPDAELAEITTYIQPFADSMDDLPTEFELNTAIAFEYFKRNGCDIVVLEAGMGGELDSTNVIDAPELAVFMHISLDHTEYLGDTIEQIAATKAGIIKPGCSVVLYRQEESVMDIIRQKCEAADAELYISEPDELEFIDMDAHRQVFKSRACGSLAIPLLGSYQKENLAVVLKAVQVLKTLGYTVSTHNISDGLESTKWPARFEIIRKVPPFVVDGGHNPDGIRAVRDSVYAAFKDEKVILIFGVMADKDYDKMLDIILPCVKEVLCVAPDNARALGADELAQAVKKKGTEAYACGCIEEAVNLAVEKAGRSTPILAAGSLYMAGDIRKYVMRSQNRQAFEQ